MCRTCYQTADKIVEKPYIVKEYHYHTYTCPACETAYTAREPEESRSGLFSVGLIGLTAYLEGESHLHIDESGWKEGGEKRWIWAFRAEKYALFIIRGSRGEEVLEEVLGKGYRGIISCVFYGTYRKFYRVAAGVSLQFCWAYLVREVLFLMKLEYAGTGDGY
jgi:hypothetical protein